jgi:hypothetical protein
MLPFPLPVPIQEILVAPHPKITTGLKETPVFSAQRNIACRISYQDAMQRGWAAFRQKNYLTARSFFECAAGKKHQRFPEAQKALNDTKTKLNQSKMRVKQTGRGAPTNTKSGAPQSGQCIGGKENLDFMLVLMPKGRVSLTSLSHPSLLIFLPETVPPTMTLKIRGEDQTNTFKLKIPKGAGIYALNLSELPNFPPLKQNMLYKWQLELNCEFQDALDRPSPLTSDGNPMVQGYIERIAPDPMLANMLKDSTREGRIEILAQEGIWYDTVSLLFEALIENPEDQILKKVWADILSEPILEPVINQPLRSRL